MTETEKAPNFDKGAEIKPELIQMAQTLSNKLLFINQNISEITSKLDHLYNDISCHYEILTNDISTSFDNLERDITSLHVNLESIKSNFRDPLKEKCDASSKNPVLSKSSDKKPKLKTRKKWKKAFGAIRFMKATTEGRKSVFSNHSFEKPEINSIPKSEEDKKIISSVIKDDNYYQESMCSEELSDLIDAMDLVGFKANHIISAQDSEVRNLHIVRTGIVDAFHDNKLSSTVQSKQMLLPFYMAGVLNNFEFRARTDGECWFIPSELFQRISMYHKRTRQKTSFFQSLNVGKKKLGDLITASEINNLSLASKEKIYKEGDVITKEGELADAFYLIEQGTVNFFHHSHGSRPFKQFSDGEFVGWISLLIADVRKFTCVAASSNVKCLMVERDAVVKIFGNIPDFFHINNERIKKRDVLTSIFKPKLSSVKIDMKLSDLDIIRELAAGESSHVKLVALKPGYAEKFGLPKQKFALRCTSKVIVEKLGTVSCILNARDAWKEIDSPFILKFYNYFEDYSYVYSLLELSVGFIDLYSHLVNSTKILESHCKFYAASILLAFEEMHTKKIACRNMKPECILVDSSGYIKLMNLKFGKKITTGKTWTVCGTSCYLSPEVIKNEGHDWGVDYWALGVMIYELIYGSAPFSADSEMEEYKNIISGKIDFPPETNLEVKNIISSLCTADQSKRFGRGGAKLVMQHLWFAGFSFESLTNKSMEAPFVPELKNTKNAVDTPSDSKMGVADLSPKLSMLETSNNDLEKSIIINNDDDDPGMKELFLHDSCTPIVEHDTSIHQRKKYNLGQNIYSLQITDLQNFQKKHFKHMILKNCSSIKKSKTSSFDQFYMLTALPNDIGPLSYESSRRSYLDPFHCKSIHVMNRYPQISSMLDNVLKPEEVTSFCFPSGVKMRLIPRCTLETGAKKIGWVGEKDDKYQTHTFTDAAGEMKYGVSVTIREVSSDSGINKLLDLRRKCRAVKIIQKFLLQKRSESRNKKKGVSGLLNKMFRPRSHTDKKEYVLNDSAQKAKESYETMLENEKLSDVCVTERCLIFIGTNPGEQSVMLCALRQLVQNLRIVHCEKPALGDVMQSNDAIENRMIMSSHFLLHRIKTKFFLSLAESQVKCPTDEYEHINRSISKVDFEPLNEYFPSVSLPLPLPNTDDWGVARLFLKFNTIDLLLTLKLLLLESPVLVIGTNSAEVSCCTSALLTLLEPFKWTSVFIPIIPDEYLDFVGSPVPFIAGMVPEDSLNLYRILADDRVTDAANDGMIVLNLDEVKITFPDQPSNKKKYAFSQILFIHNRIFHYQKRLRSFIENEDSALLSFIKFFEQGASIAEGLTIQSLKRMNRDHQSAFFRLDYDDEEQWKQFSDFDEVAQSHTFYPSKLNAHFRNQFKYLENLSHTQLFVEYLQRRKDVASRMSTVNPEDLFIADWLYFRWKQRNKSLCKF